MSHFQVELGKPLLKLSMSTINLVKGQKIEIGLSKVSVGLGWTPNEGIGHGFDLDASAFMSLVIPKERDKVDPSQIFLFR